MKKYILIVTAVLISNFVFSQNQERLSVHYFDIPQNMEGEFMKFNKKMNLLIENAGLERTFIKYTK